MRTIAALSILAALVAASFWVFQDDGSKPLFESREAFYEDRLRYFVKSETVKDKDAYLDRIDRAKKEGEIIELYCEVYHWSEVNEGC